MKFIQKIDESLLYLIQKYLVNDSLDKIIPKITRLGDAGIIWIAIGIVLLITKKFRSYGILMMGSMFLCLLVGNIILKPLIKRSRPCWKDTSVKILIPEPKDFSFPSGHTMSSFAGAMSLCYMNASLGVLGFIFATLIAFSRVYLFVHYPSDLIVGGVFGVALCEVAMKLFIP